MKRNPPGSCPETDPGKGRRHVETPFIMVPLAIARDPTLSWGAKALFGAIFSLSGLPNGCHCTNEGLGRRIGLSTRHVKRLMVELEGRQLIRRTLKNHGNTRVEVTWKGKPIRLGDKMSKGTRCPPTRGDKMSPRKGDKMSPRSRARANFGGLNDKKRGKSEPYSSDFPPSNKKPNDARPGDARSATQEQEKTSDSEAPFDFKAFRESIGLTGPARAKGITVFGDPRPVVALEDAPIQDDPIIQAAIAERKQRRKEGPP